MTPVQDSEGQSSRSLSILLRLIPALSYAIPAAVAALSAMLFVDAFQGMRNAELASFAAVAGGIAGTNLPLLIALYFATFVGAIGIILFVILRRSAKAASPTAWFFVFAGGLGFVPVALLWQAESLAVQGISHPGSDATSLALQVGLCIRLTLVAAAACVPILMATSLIPFPSALRARRTYAPLVVLVLMEVVLVGVTVAFQMRTSWLHQVALESRR